MIPSWLTERYESLTEAHQAKFGIGLPPLPEDAVEAVNHLYAVLAAITGEQPLVTIQMGPPVKIVDKDQRLRGMVSEDEAVRGVEARARRARDGDTN